MQRHPWPESRIAYLLVVVTVLGLAFAPMARADAQPLHRDVLVFIPAYEGSQLFDPNLNDDGPDDPTCVWGNANVFFSSKLYFSLRMPNRLVSRKMLAVGPADIYRGFVEKLTENQDDVPGFAPYTEGADFFIFDYDWRQEMATVTATQLARAMESYADIYAGKTGVPTASVHFIIVTHSMGGLVARTWLSENPAWGGRVSRMYLVGPPNRGSVKAVKTVVFGPDSLESHAHGFPGVLLNALPTDVDQNVTKLVGITRPSLYELLPYDDAHWIDVRPGGTRQAWGHGRLLDAETWEPFWPSADLEKRLFVDDWLKDRIAEGRKPIDASAWQFCQDNAYGHLKELLRETAAWRARQGSLQHTETLLTRGGESTRLRLIVSTGLDTPSGVVTRGRHDATEAFYTYEKSADGDGTVEAFSALDGVSPSASNVKLLQRVPHGRLMIDPSFLDYFLHELSGRPTIPARLSVR